jgi:hypothetical protein
MSNDSDQIREQIEITRGSLSTDVNSLADQVRPANVAHRQVDKVRGAAGSAKDKIMGTASDLGSTGSSKAGDVGSTLIDAASSSKEAIASAPGAVAAQTQGNPLAAGLIAFGVGMVVASLLPATEKEKQAATALKENASVVTDPLTDAAKEVGGHLQAPAQDAVDAVKSSATDAAATVKSEGTAAAQDVKDQGLDATQAVQDSRN